MPFASLQANEAERLRALHASGMLESGSDPRLDDIVRRAADLFETPIAAITLLDETRQVFKASVGIGVPYTPRDVALCNHTISSERPFVVLDAANDPRVAEHPLVNGPAGVRFYVGDVVYGPKQQPFGALCVVDRVARAAVTPAMLASLQAMAEEVSAVFANPGV